MTSFSASLLLALLLVQPAKPQPKVQGAPATPIKKAAPSSSAEAPDVHLGLEDASREIFIADHFNLILTVTAKPDVTISLPSKIVGGPRFQVEGEPKKLDTELLDNGKVKTTWRITLASYMTDRLIDKKLERVNTRLKRREADLSEAKTLLTKAKLDGKETTAITERIAKIEGRIRTDKAELASLRKRFELHPIPITARDKSGNISVVQSHEPGLGPKIVISSKLANEPNPQLKEPASEENKKAGGPFWKPYSIYEENTTLKNILWGILIGLGVFALLIPLFLFIRKKLKKEKPAPPPRPAHEIALERLTVLREKGLPEEEETKHFAFELSEILREYFGNRYNFYSLEMTTTELLAKLQEIAPSELTQGDLEEFFEQLDLYKFAKLPLAPSDFPQYLEEGTEMVTKTRFVAPLVEEEGAEDETEDKAEDQSSARTGHTLDSSLGDDDSRYLPGGSSAPPAPPPPLETAPAEEAEDALVTTQEATDSSFTPEDVTPPEDERDRTDDERFLPKTDTDRELRPKEPALPKAGAATLVEPQDDEKYLPKQTGTVDLSAQPSAQPPAPPEGAKTLVDGGDDDRYLPKKTEVDQGPATLVEPPKAPSSENKTQATQPDDSRWDGSGTSAQGKPDNNKTDSKDVEE